MNKKSIYIAVIQHNYPFHSLLCLNRDHKVKIQVIPWMQQAPEAIQSLPCWVGGTNIGAANTVSEMVRKHSSMVGLAHVSSSYGYTLTELDCCRRPRR